MFNVAYLMNINGLSRDDLAQLVGMSRGNLGRTLSGEHALRLDTLDRFAKAFDVEPYQLLTLPPVPIAGFEYQRERGESVLQTIN